MTNYCNVLTLFLDKNYYSEFLSMITMEDDMSLLLVLSIINLQGAPSF